MFDLSPCVAVHASTLACALLAYDASVVVYRPPLLAPPRVKRAEVRGIAEFLGTAAIRAARTPSRMATS